MPEPDNVATAEAPDVQDAPKPDAGAAQLEEQLRAVEREMATDLADRLSLDVQLDQAALERVRRLVPTNPKWWRTKKFFEWLRPFLLPIAQAKREGAMKPATTQRPQTTAEKNKKGAKPAPEVPLTLEERLPPALMQQLDRAFYDAQLSAIVDGSMDDLLAVVFDADQATLDDLTSAEIMEGMYFFYVGSMTPLGRLISIASSMA